MTPQELKDWRIAKGLTQDQAGYLFGITRLAQRNREQGKAKISPETEMAVLYLDDHPEALVERLKGFVPTQ